MTNRTSFVSLTLVCALAGLGERARGQTLSVPGGTVTNSNNTNVGVGVTSPAYKFQVSLAANQQVATYLSTASAATDFGAGGSGWQFSRPEDGAFAHAIYSYNSPGGAKNNLAISSRNDLVFTAGSGGPNSAPERMRIVDNGNVGVGTSTPGARVEILSAGNGVPATSGTSQPNASLRLGNTQTDGILDLGINSGNGAWLQYSNRSNLALSYPLLLNPSGGNVGVGVSTTTPGAKLEVLASSNGMAATAGTSQPNASLRLGNNQTDGILDLGINSGNGAWLQYTNRTNLAVNYPLLLNPNGGNVGIGTTNPTQKLSVNGTIQAKEVIVQTGWSDFVFEKDYQLQPLSTVEQVIKKEGHLPGVPSAREVADHGVSLGSVEAILLAKIEELTLHQITQEKKITALETKNVALETQVAELQKSKLMER